MLITTLVAVPVAGATIVDGVYRTTADPAYRAYQVMAGGDAVIEVTPYAQMPEGFTPEADMSWGGDPGATTRDPDTVDLTALLPPGTTLVPAPVEFGGIRIVRGESTVRSAVIVAELGHGLTRNRARLVNGAWPRHDNEVLITAPLADRLSLRADGDVRTGATLTLRDGPAVTVTGIGLDPRWISGETILAAPGSVVAEHLAAQDRPGHNWETVT